MAEAKREEVGRIGCGHATGGPRCAVWQRGQIAVARSQNPSQIGVAVHPAGGDDHPAGLQLRAIGQLNGDGTVGLRAVEVDHSRALLAQGHRAGGVGGIQQGPRIADRIDACIVGKPDASHKVGCCPVGCHHPIPVPPFAGAAQSLQGVKLLAQPLHPLGFTDHQGSALLDLLAGVWQQPVRQLQLQIPAPDRQFEIGLDAIPAVLIGKAVQHQIGRQRHNHLDGSGPLGPTLEDRGATVLWFVHGFFARDQRGIGGDTARR